MDLAAFNYKEQEIKATGPLKLPQFLYICMSRHAMSCRFISYDMI